MGRRNRVFSNMWIIPLLSMDLQRIPTWVTRTSQWWCWAPSFALCPDVLKNYCPQTLSVYRKRMTITAARSTQVCLAKWQDDHFQNTSSYYTILKIPVSMHGFIIADGADGAKSRAVKHQWILNKQSCVVHRYHRHGAFARRHRVCASMPQSQPTSRRIKFRVT